MAISSTPIPRTKKAVRSFLGAVGFYRRFIKNFAEIAWPLHKLTKNDICNTRIPWSEECETSFKLLKGRLMRAPILGSIDYSQTVVLRTDASGVAIAGVLSQVKGKEDVIISYYSRVLQPHEFVYDITTKEGLALISSVRNYAVHLRFAEGDFHIITDHAPLQWIFKKKKKWTRK